MTESSEFVRATETFMAIHNRDTDEWRRVPRGDVIQLEPWEVSESVVKGDVHATYNLLPAHFPALFEAIPAELAPGAAASQVASA